VPVSAAKAGKEKKKAHRKIPMGLILLTVPLAGKD
jgi:hypothetical protein